MNGEGLESQEWEIEGQALCDVPIPFRICK